MYSDRFYGLGDFKAGDVVNVVLPNDDRDLFGIWKRYWETASRFSPYIIEEVVVRNESDELYSGYRLANDENINKDYRYIWPCWGLELANGVSIPTVEDLL